MENIERYFIWRGNKIIINGGFTGPQPNVVNLIKFDTKEKLRSMLIVFVPKLLPGANCYTLNAKFTNGLPKFGRIMFIACIGNGTTDSPDNSCAEGLYVEFDRVIDNERCIISTFVRDELNGPIKYVGHVISTDQFDDNVIISASCNNSLVCVSVLNTSIKIERQFKKYDEPDDKMTFVIVNSLNSAVKFIISDSLSNC